MYVGGQHTSGVEADGALKAEDYEKVRDAMSQSMEDLSGAASSEQSASSTHNRGITKKSIKHEVPIDPIEAKKQEEKPPSSMLQ